MARGNQRDKAREANQKKLADQVSCNLCDWFASSRTVTLTTNFFLQKKGNNMTGSEMAREKEKVAAKMREKQAAGECGKLVIQAFMLTISSWCEEGRWNNWEEIESSRRLSEIANNEWYEIKLWWSFHWWRLYLSHAWAAGFMRCLDCAALNWYLYNTQSNVVLQCILRSMRRKFALLEDRPHDQRASWYANRVSKVVSYVAKSTLFSSESLRVCF